MCPVMRRRRRRIWYTAQTTTTPTKQNVTASTAAMVDRSARLNPRSSTTFARISHASPENPSSHTQENDIAISSYTHSPAREQFDENASSSPGHRVEQFVPGDANPGAHRRHRVFGRHSYTSAPTRTSGSSYIFFKSLLPSSKFITMVGIEMESGGWEPTQLTAASGSNSVSMMTAATAPAF